MARVLEGLPVEQGTRQKDKDVTKEIKRVRVRAPPSCWLTASFPLSFCFLLRLFLSPSSPLLLLSVLTPPASALACLNLFLFPYFLLWPMLGAVASVPDVGLFVILCGISHFGSVLLPENGFGKRIVVGPSLFGYP
ncbi:hypothetical protein ACLB2K_065814 [Fragaria x ananassa]